MFTEESRLSPLSEDALYATLLKHVPFIPLLCIPCRGEGKVTRCSSPSYEIVESDEHYQIVVDLPVIEGKLHAKVEHGRRVLHIVEEVYEGGTLSPDDGRKRFEMRFLLGGNVNANQVAVEFEDAVLTVTAGKIAVEGNEGSSTINLPVLEHHLHPLDDHAKDALLAKESYNERFEEAH
jgi:Molecular chaperone (small heat shock protein)